MKKFLALLLISLMLCSVFASCNADDFDVDAGENGDAAEVDLDALPESSAGLEFALNSDGTGYTLTGIGSCTDKNIVIGKYNGLPVTDTKFMALSGCTEITSLTIGDGVERIGTFSFGGCRNIETLKIGKNVKVIDDNAFQQCDALVTLTIPGNVKSVCDGSFQESSNLTEVVFEKGFEQITGKAFLQCTRLKSVTFNLGVTKLSARAFEGCSSLEEIKFNGTKAQWESIEKENGWDRYTGDYVVKCSDGDIAKTNLD